MNKLRLILLVAVLAQSLLTLTALGQVPSARRLTRSVVPQPSQTNAPVRPTPRGVQAPATATTPRVPLRQTPTQALVRIVQPPADPAKTKAAKDAAIQRTIEFQKKRAEEGSESAQYELGLRYLKGDGLEKNETAARKWLSLSAKNGYGPATRKLEELDRSVAEPKPADSGK